MPGGIRSLNRIPKSEGDENMTNTTIEKGSQVRILGNAKGTAWETGYVVDINEDGALINFGSWQIPVYGMGIRKPLDKLEVI